MDFEVAVNSFATKEIDCQDPTNLVLKNNASGIFFLISSQCFLMVQ